MGGRKKEYYCQICEKKIVNRKANAKYCRECAAEKIIKDAENWRKNNKEWCVNYQRDHRKKKKELKDAKITKG